MTKLSTRPDSMRQPRAATAAAGAMSGRSMVALASTDSDTPEAFVREVGIVSSYEVISRQGFYQDAAGRLQLPPLAFWPSVFLMDGYDEKSATVPPKDSRLIAAVSYVLGSTGYPGNDSQGAPITRIGWSGAVNSTQVQLTWAKNTEPVPPNVIFLSTYANSMPPQDTFVWHFVIGSTDGAGAFTLNPSADRIGGLFIPPF